jgi:preprotein translocase subunit SecE
MEKEIKKKPAAPPKKKRVSMGEYFRGIKTETKKVVWPTRKELGAFTAVVVLTCAFFAVGFWIVDSAVLAALRAVLGITL